MPISSLTDPGSPAPGKVIMPFMGTPVSRSLIIPAMAPVITPEMARPALAGKSSPRLICQGAEALVRPMSADRDMPRMSSGT